LSISISTGSSKLACPLYFLAERASNISKCAKDSMLVKSIKCQIDPPLMDGRTLNQQWVLIADSTKALSASFFPDCPIAQPR